MLANTDTVTGLPNRNAIHQRMTEVLEKREDRQVGVVYMDLDNFKRSTTPTGICSAISCCRRFRWRCSPARAGTDAGTTRRRRIYRAGGKTTQEALEALAVRIPARLRQPFRIGLIEVYTGCSVGIALAPHHGEDRESLIRNADTAMYHAKENGRGQACVFSPEMNQRVFEYLWLDTNLRKALEHQQLIIHYQPKISEGGKVVGAEALVRWLSPERGMIPPNEFISYAEESGLIVPLGRWVMLTALQQIIAWRRGAFTCASR